MLIEAARRVETAAKEMLSATNGPSVSRDEAREVLAVCKSAMAALAATQTSAAAVVAGVENHGDGGVQVLADAAGLSRRDAVRRVKTAQAVGAAPAVRDAVETGRVSQANAKRLAEAIEKTSAEAVESDTELLSKAASMRPEQFTREARKWAADRQGDGGEGDYRRLRARRRVRVWDSDDDGMVHIHGEFDPVAGHRIGNRLRSVAGRLHDLDKAQASNKSERRSFDQCTADALDSLTAGNLADHRDCSSNAVAGGGSRSRSSVRSGRGSDDRSTVESGRGAGSRSGADTGNSGGSGGRRPIADICVVAHVDSDTGNLVAELPDGTRLPAAVLEELACNARLTGVVFDRNGKPIWAPSPSAPPLRPSARSSSPATEAASTARPTPRCARSITSGRSRMADPPGSTTWFRSVGTATRRSTTTSGGSAPPTECTPFTRRGERTTAPPMPRKNRPCICRVPTRHRRRAPRLNTPDPRPAAGCSPSPSTGFDESILFNPVSELDRHQPESHGTRS